MKTRTVSTIIIFLGMILFGILGRAATLLSDMPKDSISASDALKLKKPVYQCAKKHLGGKLGNPVNVKNAKSYYFASIPNGLESDAADTLLSDGKPVVFCKLVEHSSETHKWINSDE